jgi:hypothetical protein
MEYVKLVHVVLLWLAELIASGKGSIYWHSLKEGKGRGLNF